jgi:hypothetical protein
MLPVKVFSVAYINQEDIVLPDVAEQFAWKGRAFDRERGPGQT